jgi:hypothetical protein
LCYEFSGVKHEKIACSNGPNGHVNDCLLTQSNSGKTADSYTLGSLSTGTV